VATIPGEPECFSQIGIRKSGCSPREQVRHLAARQAWVEGSQIGHIQLAQKQGVGFSESRGNGIVPPAPVCGAGLARNDDGVLRGD